jgi:hypothetical protein
MRPLVTLAAVLATTAPLVACSSGGAAPRPRATVTRPSPSTLGSGFYDPASPPPPEGTLTPRPGSWATAVPPAGYRVVLITSGTDAPTRTLVAAVRRWADAQHVDLTTLRAARSTELVPVITRALSLAPDLIVSAGDRLVDALATVTPSHLDQQFLVIGAELAEPTANVTAADWAGASYRGEGLGRPATYDAASFTPARAGRAVRAGVAAVLNGVTGVVVRID